MDTFCIGDGAFGVLHNIRGAGVQSNVINSKCTVQHLQGWAPPLMVEMVIPDVERGCKKLHAGHLHAHGKYI